MSDSVLKDKWKRLLIIVVTVFCVMGCAAVYVYYLHSTLTKDLRVRLLETAQQTGNTVHVGLDAGLAELQSVGYWLHTQESFDLQHALQLLYAYDEGQENFFQMGIIMPDGNGYSKDFEHVNFADRDYFQKAMNGEGNIAQFMPDRISGMVNSTFAVPIVGPDGEVQAVLAASKAAKEFGEILNAVHFSDKGLLAMVNAQGDRLIMQESADKAVEFMNLSQLRFAKDMTWLDALAAHPTGTLRFYAENESAYYMAYVPVGVNDWYIISMLPARATEKNITTLTIVAILLWLSLAIIFLLISLYIIRARSQYSSQLENIAFVDSVTGGDNYNAFAMQFEKSMHRCVGVRFALVMMDIDKFKAVNDIFGYANGDKMLRNIVDICRNSLRDGECMARVSADNFLLLLRYESDSEIVDRIEQMLNTVQSNISSYKLIFFYGIFKIQDCTETLGMCSDRANLAKRTVKGQYQTCGAFYQEDFSAQMLREKELENEMDSALREEQFKLYVQPAFFFSTGQPAGAEGLVRWLHPQKGTIYPDQFIPLFEKNHFIEKLDIYLFEQVCKILQQWTQEGETMLPCISMNFSRVHLNNMELPTLLLDIMQRYELEPGCIGIELTESASFENEARLIWMMRSLRAAGFPIFIDDFGSGYSSLNALKDLQVDYLKFDRGFLGDLENNKRGQEILRNLVHLAKDLQLDTVAEGVETVSQAQFLREIGFDIAQGYLYSKPMPVEELPELLRKLRETKHGVFGIKE